MRARRLAALAWTVVALVALVTWTDSATGQPPPVPTTGRGPEPVTESVTESVTEPATEPATEPPPATEHAAEAASATAQPHPGEALTVYVLTMGPGDHPFFKFGHNAIWIHDAKEGSDRVYNYGTFNFGSLSVIPKFFLGRSLYSLSTSSIRSTIRSYRRENRSLVAQRLELSPEQRVELRDFLVWNRLKENRYYRYDYYRDNCTTRVRDAVDRLLGGRIQQAARGPASMTHRAHTLRLTADLVPEYVVLLLALGHAVDNPVDRWQETFLPERLHALLQEVRVPGPAGEIPLVREERVLLRAERAEAPAAPPAWMPWFLLVGTATGAGLAWLGRAGRTSRRARISSAVLTGVLGLLLGFFGTAFCLLWALTDHEVAYRNENILQCAPWLLAAPVLAAGVARRRARATRRAFLAWSAAAICCALGLALKLLPWFYQYNGQVIAFALPATVGAAMGSRWLHLATATPTAR